MPSPGEALAVTTAIVVALAVTVLAVLAGTLATPHAGPPASCREWSDGCMVCRRLPAGTAACSTPGIACVPGPLRCLAR
ncbi:hypothetical protein C4E04_16030 [Microvirga sp. 17 mud 1-3]|nr:hypothetical protein C4E04_16030 [Microvirga sp. 17 mud 1-3]